MDIVQAVRDAGVVGAGGAGFPTHVKLGSKVDYVLANGAECEPLLHKDAELTEAYAPASLRMRAFKAVSLPWLSQPR